MRKNIKRHTDKLKQDFKLPESRLRKNPTTREISSSKTIQQNQIDVVYSRLFGAYSEMEKGQISKIVGNVLDNIHKCPASEYHYLMSLTQRISNIVNNYDVDDYDQFIDDCRKYLKMVSNPLK